MINARLFSSMNCWGSYLVAIWVYSGWSSWVSRWKLLISIPRISMRHWNPHCLNAVWQWWGQQFGWWPVVNLIFTNGELDPFGYSLLWTYIHDNLDIGHFSIFANGMGGKYAVFVPLMLFSLLPWANWPSYSYIPLSQMWHVWGSAIKCQNSCFLPAVGQMMALTYVVDTVSESVGSMASTSYAGW